VITELVLDALEVFLNVEVVKLVKNLCDVQFNGCHGFQLKSLQGHIEILLHAVNSVWILHVVPKGLCR